MSGKRRTTRSQAAPRDKVLPMNSDPTDGTENTDKKGPVRSAEKRSSKSETKILDTKSTAASVLLPTPKRTRVESASAQKGPANSSFKESARRSDSVKPSTNHRDNHILTKEPTSSPTNVRIKDQEEVAAAFAAHFKTPINKKLWEYRPSAGDSYHEGFLDVLVNVANEAEAKGYSYLFGAEEKREIRSRFEKFICENKKRFVDMIDSEQAESKVATELMNEHNQLKNEMLQSRMREWDDKIKTLIVETDFLDIEDTDKISMQLDKQSSMVVFWKEECEYEKEEKDELMNGNKVGERLNFFVRFKCQHSDLDYYVGSSILEGCKDTKEWYTLMRMKKSKVIEVSCPILLIEMEALVHRMVIGDNPDGALPTTILRNEMFDKEDFVSAKTKIDRSVQEEMRRRFPA